MFASAHPMGHFSQMQIKAAMMSMGVVQMEMERMKMMPGQMIEGHLDCLNKSVATRSCRLWLVALTPDRADGPD